MNAGRANPSPELSVVDWLRFLARNRLLIGVCALAFGVVGAALAFLLHPKYRADTVFVAAQDVKSPGLGQLTGDLGGLAAMAGINLGGSSSKIDESLEYLRSRAFTAGFIERHQLMPILFAKNWDSARKTWTTSVDDRPTLADGVEKFSNSMRQVIIDRRSNIVTLSVTWIDPTLAA